MTPPNPKDIISSVNEIGVLPQTLKAVLEVLDNPNSGAKEIANIISKDLSLTTRVLKMVNSVNYGRHRKISRITEAVSVVGFNSIRFLTLGSSVFGLMSAQELSEKFSIKSVGRHLIEVATISQSISEEINYASPEEAFIAGILHDVGIMVMILHYREKYSDVIARLNSAKCGILKAEDEVFGLNHCDVGVELIDSWKLPIKLVMVIQNHHSANPAGLKNEDAVLNNIISLADRLTLGPFQRYYPSIEENLEVIRQISEKLGISSEALDKIRKESIIKSIELAEYLELDTGDLKEILSDASNKLADLFLSLEKIYHEKQELQKKVSEMSVESVKQSA